MQGKFVLIRTFSAGVHFGTLIERNGKEVRLKDARRLWSWSGALSLSEIAMKGIKITGSKISVPVDEIILTEAIEIIQVSQNSNLPGNEVKRSVSAKV
jgi:hypothetical protein